MRDAVSVGVTHQVPDAVVVAVVAVVAVVVAVLLS